MCLVLQVSGGFGKELCHFRVCQLAHGELDPGDGTLSGFDAEEVAVLTNPTDSQLQAVGHGLV